MDLTRRVDEGGGEGAYGLGLFVHFFWSTKNGQIGFSRGVKRASRVNCIYFTNTGFVK